MSGARFNDTEHLRCEGPTCSGPVRPPGKGNKKGKPGWRGTLGVEPQHGTTDYYTWPLKVAFIQMY